MDRPEFLAEVPKVCKICSIFYVSYSFVIHLVFELRRNRFKYIDAQGCPNAQFFGSAHIQDDQASPRSIHPNGALPHILRGQPQIDVRVGPRLNEARVWR